MVKKQQSHRVQENLLKFGMRPQKLLILSKMAITVEFVRNSLVKPKLQLSDTTRLTISKPNLNLFAQHVLDMGRKKSNTNSIGMAFTSI